MNILSLVENFIHKIWESPLKDEITSKKIDVSKYNNLSSEIPDKYLKIEEVFPKNEIEEIWSNFEPYLSEYEIYPFIRTFDESVICIGYGDDNSGEVYYFNFDFGCIKLDSNFEVFLSKISE